MLKKGIVITDILVAHPGKHHALHLVAGCVKSGASVQFITPFYRKGLGRLVAVLPGNIGSKADGYFHPDIPLKSVVSPVRWQLRKLFSQYKRNLSYEKKFDEYVASGIEAGKYKAKVLITLQDYMPDTVRAAKMCGYTIWSDQILNQSEGMASRLLRHEQAQVLSSFWQHNEHNNNVIIETSDVITVPSKYCFDGIKERIKSNTKVVTIPYGADSDQFSAKRVENPKHTFVLARAQSFRKGGHLLIAALQQCGAELLAINYPMKIKFVVMGDLEPILHTMLNDFVLPEGLTIEFGNVAHSKVAMLYKQASLFVMPSLSEGRSLACIEAMQASLPLIITPYCGVDGFVHGQMGYEIQDTKESLAMALVDAFKNKDLWGHWGLNSKHLASKLNWPAYEVAICKLVKEIIC